MATLGFPHLEWHTGASKKGVTLRQHGDGEPVFIFPGAEGSGESCLHLAAPVIQQARSAVGCYRLVLVDYAEEAHETLDELVETMSELIRQAARTESCVFWGQSFGNLLAAGIPSLGEINVRKFVMVSPFTALPSWRAHIGTISMYFIPTFFYRATIGLIGKYTFGPVGDQRNHPFFDALRRGTPGVMRRRTGWLRSRVFDERLAETPAPTKVWLGERDRLVNLNEQSTFFAELTGTRPDYFLCMTEGCGHVFLPSRSVRRVHAELLEWLTRGK